MNLTLIMQLALNGLSFGALLFLVASGFTVVFGLMRITNLAHGSFYLVGGYVAVIVAANSGSYWLGIAAGAVAAAIVGVVTERGLLRRVRNMEMPEVLVTVGVLFVVGDVLLAIFGGDPKSVPPSTGMPSGALVIGDLSYPMYRLFIIGFTVAVGVLLFFVQARSKIGAIVRAGVDDRETVAAMGIDIDRVFTGVFAVGALLAGLAGGIGAGLLSLTPASGVEILLYAMVVVIIGGLGSISGAALGAVLIGLIDAFSKAFIPEFAYFTVFAPMALVLVVRPQGLFGKVS